MKKITTFIFLVLGSFNYMFSSTNDKMNQNHTFGFDYNNPIQFAERGIDFYVFLDGQFDFNTCTSNVNGVEIEYDRWGRVRRVGNVFMNYDYFGRIKRIGTVFLQYNDFALIQIGGLHIQYNYRGEVVDFFGSIKPNECYGQMNYQMNNNFQYSRNPNANLNQKSHNQLFYRKSEPKVLGNNPR